MITVFVSSSFSVDAIHKLIMENNHLLDNVLKVSPSMHILNYLNNVDYLGTISADTQLVIVKDAHLMFPKEDFNLKVMLEFLALKANLWLLVPKADLLHQLILESVSRVEEIAVNRNGRALLYNNSLEWITDEDAEKLSSGKGFIFWGESGVGKSRLALELANSMNATVVHYRCFDLVHGGVGESEKALENLFKRAKDAQPSVLVLDDLDTLFKPRGDSGDLALKMVAQLIMELDEIQFNQIPVLFFGTAVNYNDLDESLWKGKRLYLYHVEKKQKQNV